MVYISFDMAQALKNENKFIHIAFHNFEDLEYSFGLPETNM